MIRTYVSGSVNIPLDPVESEELMDIVQHVLALSKYLPSYEQAFEGNDEYDGLLSAEADSQARGKERLEAEFGAKYPDLVGWAEKLLNDSEVEGFFLRQPEWEPDGVSFVSATDFSEEFATRIAQFAVQRYGLAPIMFFANHNDLESNPFVHFGRIYTVSADNIEVISTDDLIKRHEEKLIQTDLLACVCDSRLDAFRTLYRSKDWGDQARAALKLAARQNHPKTFAFLIEEGVPADDPGLMRILGTSPALKAMVEARKLSTEIQAGECAKDCSRAAFIRKGI